MFVTRVLHHILVSTGAYSSPNAGVLVSPKATVLVCSDIQLILAIHGHILTHHEQTTDSPPCEGQCCQSVCSIVQLHSQVLIKLMNKGFSISKLFSQISICIIILWLWHSVTMYGLFLKPPALSFFESILILCRWDQDSHISWHFDYFQLRCLSSHIVYIPIKMSWKQGV